MKNLIILTGLFFSITLSSFAKVPVIFHFKEAKGTELLALKELRRYLYVRTGELPVIKTILLKEKLPGNSILVATISEIKNDYDIKRINIDSKINGQGYQLKSTANNSLLIIGGSEIGTLYGAYKFIESTGIGFDLDEDIIPDKKLMTINLSGFDKTYEPSFTLRGIQPFHDFPEGPDWWNENNYEAIITQLPKMGMNFIGFHTYPTSDNFGGWSKAEPMVWIGTKNQFHANGTVKAAYPVLHSNTNDSTWNYYPKKTSEFNLGASQIFETDNYGADYMKNISKWPHTENENIEIFDKVGKLLHNSFTLAKELGVKTCIGTETPLSIPTELKQKLLSEHKDINSYAVKQEIYEGIFARIKATHPMDYYWFWTPESWTWEGETKDEVDATEKDIQNAIAAAKKMNAGFTLATCGWVLGPSRDRAEFDNIFPKDMPFSVINRQIGYTPVEPAFADIKGRPKWEISWMEDDPGLTSPQLWAARTLKDAQDAYKYGCTGFMGIHWRTKILSPTLMALSKAGWEAASYKKEIPANERDYPVAALYKEWATLHFGKKAALPTAAIFTKLDGGPLYISGKNQLVINFPRSSQWGDKGPGLISTNYKPWDEVEKNFDFIKDFEKSKSLITGPNNMEHFNYWLNTFYYAKALAHISCFLGQMDTTSKLMIKADASTKKHLAEKLLHERNEMATVWSDMETYLLETVSTTGGMGTIANIEQHNMEQMLLLSRYDSLITATTGSSVAPVELSKAYKGVSRLIITAKRTLLHSGENLNFRTRILSKNNIESAIIYWKPLVQRILKA
ncbi:MAG TPA: alpha-glucuronidase family glycosyl hydrolase [Hanamia sp.]|nr:alpha-glucuronidase family glycosyl hydrolase [Hanamia sp.]